MADKHALNFFSHSLFKNANQNEIFIQLSDWQKCKKKVTKGDHA